MTRRYFTHFLKARFLSVVSPITIATDASTAFNVNADLAGDWVAGTMDSPAFVTITNVPRVLRDFNDKSSAIDQMTPLEAQTFANSEACLSA